jgi:proteasome accessory factor A
VTLSERLFGIETEYAFSVIRRSGSAPSRNSDVCHLLDLARRRLTHLPDMHGHGMYLANGARLYLDCGLHPEMTTPECANPWDAVRYTLAGERMLAQLAAELVGGDGRIEEVVLTKCNVDYTGPQTWACHESYGHQADPLIFPAQIIPHLVSRIIYCGAGGFNNRSAGMEFTISPRAWHMAQAISSDSTHDRGIFHTKDESLSSDGYHRLHLLCGESLCSHTASWLKIATTALVVAMIEAGLRPGSKMAISSPVQSLQAFASDPDLKVTILAASGNRTALEIQRHYLGCAEANMRESFMPPWAPQACETWREMLDRLEQGRQAVARQLDWAIKQELYAQRAAQRGVAWDSLPDWTHVVSRLEQAIKQTKYRDQIVKLEFVIGRSTPIPEEILRLKAYVQAKGLDWDHLQTFWALRRELFEIDARFGQLGDRGIFQALDKAGVLRHAFAGVDNIEHAMQNPPAIGRGRVRGECIRRLAADGQRYSCFWTGILDQAAETVLNLSDPFTCQEKWRARREFPGGASEAPMFWFCGETGATDPVAAERLRERIVGVLRARNRRTVTSDGFRLGDRVVLGRHDSVNGSDNWNSPMDAFVGRTAVIVEIGDTDQSGCQVVRVDVDRARWSWRTGNLQRASPAPAVAGQEASHA